MVKQLLNHFLNDANIFSFNYSMAIKSMQCKCVIFCIIVWLKYSHINQCNVSVQYFAVLHANKYCMIA